MSAPDLHLRLSRRFLRHVLAAGSVALVLWLTVLAASPALHGWLHGNAGEGDHECAVTLYQHGMETAAVGVSVIVAVRVFVGRSGLTPPTRDCPRARYWLPPALAPPPR